MSITTTQSVKTARKRRRRISRHLWMIWLLPCIGTAGYALVRYLIIPPTQGPFAHKLPLLPVHATAGAIALLTGPWQFWTWLRNNRVRMHRWLGYVYLSAVAVASIAGFVLALHSEEGWPTHWGFGLLAVAWFATAWMGYSTARAGRFQVHRQWMVRSFALSLAAVTLRNELPLFLFAAHLSFHISYIIVSWLCWVPNLAVAEWWLARQRTQ